MAANNKFFTIDQLAKISGFSTRTLRFYAQEKLLPPPVKFEGRIALYSSMHVRTIEVIKKLKDDYFLPLEMIKMAITHPEKSKFLRARPEIIGDILSVLGFQPPTLSQKAFIRKANLESRLVSKLEKDGFFHPASTDKGPRYSTNDLAVAKLLRELMKLGFDLDKLKFVPETLSKMTKEWVEAFEDFKQSIIKSGKTLPLGKKIVSINRELTALLLQELFLQAIIGNRTSAKGQS